MKKFISILIVLLMVGTVFGGADGILSGGTGQGTGEIDKPKDIDINEDVEVMLVPGLKGKATQAKAKATVSGSSIDIDGEISISGNGILATIKNVKGMNYDSLGDIEGTANSGCKITYNAITKDVPSGSKFRLSGENFEIIGTGTGQDITTKQGTITLPEGVTANFQVGNKIVFDEKGAQVKLKDGTQVKITLGKCIFENNNFINNGNDKLVISTTKDLVKEFQFFELKKDGELSIDSGQYSATNYLRYYFEDQFKTSTLTDSKNENEKLTVKVDNNKIQNLQIFSPNTAQNPTRSPTSVVITDPKGNVQQAIMPESKEGWTMTVNFANLLLPPPPVDIISDSSSLKETDGKKNKEIWEDTENTQVWINDAGIASVGPGKITRNSKYIINSDINFDTRGYVGKQIGGISETPERTEMSVKEYEDFSTLHTSLTDTTLAELGLNIGGTDYQISEYKDDIEFFTRGPSFLPDLEGLAKLKSVKEKMTDFIDISYVNSDNEEISAILNSKGAVFESNGKFLPTYFEDNIKLITTSTNSQSTTDPIKDITLFQYSGLDNGLKAANDFLKTGGKSTNDAEFKSAKETNLPALEKAYQESPEGIAAKAAAEAQAKGLTQEEQQKSADDAKKQANAKQTPISNQEWSKDADGNTIIEVKNPDGSFKAKYKEITLKSGAKLYITLKKDGTEYVDKNQEKEYYNAYGIRVTDKGLDYIGQGQQYSTVIGIGKTITKLEENIEPVLNEYISIIEEIQVKYDANEKRIDEIQAIILNKITLAEDLEFKKLIIENVEYTKNMDQLYYDMNKVRAERNSITEGTLENKKNTLNEQIIAKKEKLSDVNIKLSDFDKGDLTKNELEDMKQLQLQQSTFKDEIEKLNQEFSETELLLQERPILPETGYVDPKTKIIDSKLKMPDVTTKEVTTQIQKMYLSMGFKLPASMKSNGEPDGIPGYETFPTGEFTLKDANDLLDDVTDEELKKINGFNKDKFLSYFENDKKIEVQLINPIPADTAKRVNEQLLTVIQNQPLLSDYISQKFYISKDQLDPLKASSKIDTNTEIYLQTFKEIATQMGYTEYQTKDVKDFTLEDAEKISDIIVKQRDLNNKKSLTLEVIQNLIPENINQEIIALHTQNSYVNPDRVETIKNLKQTLSGLSDAQIQQINTDFPLDRTITELVKIIQTNTETLNKESVEITQNDLYTKNVQLKNMLIEKISDFYYEKAKTQPQEQQANYYQQSAELYYKANQPTIEGLLKAETLTPQNQNQLQLILLNEKFLESVEKSTSTELKQKVKDLQAKQAASAK